MTTLQAKVESHLTELRRHELINEVYKRNIRELYEQEVELFEKKLDAADFFREMEEVRRELRSCRQGVVETQGVLQATDNYLDKYLPFKVQNYITETLTNVMPRQSLSKLNDYIQHKYNILKQHVENDNGKPDLNKVECQIPVIQQIELLVQKELSPAMLNS